MSGTGAEKRAASLTERFEDPQDRLLIDLGRASHIYPALQPGLKSRRPAAVDLDTTQAYEFLNGWASRLIDMGFGVILPTWWKASASRPALHLSVKPAGEEGGLGLPPSYRPTGRLPSETRRSRLRNFSRSQT